MAQGGYWSVSSNNGVANSSVAASDNWTFVAQTFDGVNQNLYIDGQLAGTFADSVNPSQNFIDIGRNANALTR